MLTRETIVVTENAFRFMEKRGVNPRNRPRVTETVLDATRLVGRPIFFSMAIIILAFVPVFALTGELGRLFKPLAFTKTFSMAAASLLSITIIPVLMVYFITSRVLPTPDSPPMNTALASPAAALRQAASKAASCSARPTNAGLETRLATEPF